ncbi:MAG: leucyl aminopeptidase [Bdellovibrionales bacterium CG10_big_fil_rev_8_21_14_0_10_45_34]|nr:MAG: leucyl aminopeptidase [Bdellovibrionales bacterium CG10_big_fil_rev_8_21_14_0_10_45_34]
MRIKVSSGSLPKSGVECLIVFCGQKSSSDKAKAKKSKSELVLHGGTRQLNQRIQESFEVGRFKAKPGEVLMWRGLTNELAQNLLAVGLGEESEFELETLRRSAGCAYRALDKEKLKSATVSVESLTGFSKNLNGIGQALSEGLVLASYAYVDFKKEAREEKQKNDLTYEFLCASKNEVKAFQAGATFGEELAKNVNFARWLGDSPGNVINPENLANEAAKAAKGTALQVTIWDKARIKKEKMGCLLGVGSGSDYDPRFIIMEYKGAAGKKPICFVGKGLTFDSGGISIKPSAGMEEMKFDMCGGAAVIGTMLALAKLKIAVNAIGIVPASENMPGPSANKPGDILVARNGKTVEVNNTDAEGRLILADAICFASEKKPQFIVDAATLTGAMVMALGDTHSGYFCNDKELYSKIESAAEAAGEVLWRMPLVKEHTDDMRGIYADLSNIPSRKGAGSAKGAAFLKEFVGEGIPYAHFDIAGTAWDVGHRIPYYCAKGASGVMVRTFVQLALAYSR